MGRGVGWGIGHHLSESVGGRVGRCVRSGNGWGKCSPGLSGGDRHCSCCSLGGGIGSGLGLSHTSGDGSSFGPCRSWSIGRGGR